MNKARISYVSVIAIAASSAFLPAAAADPVEATSTAPGGESTSLTRGGPIRALYGDVSPFYGDISPFWGDISPFYGDISPFWGDISPFYGDISPFWGDISPFYGDISPFWGDISPFYGDISPFWGDISPFYRDISPFWGDISPFYGDISPFWGDISPFYGDISPFYGDISPFYGDISPFYGDIAPFYGDIAPFYGDISPFYGDISPFYGDIAPFWGDISPFMGELRAAWGDIAPFSADAGDLPGMFEALISRSEAFWGRAVEARTGRSFREGFVADLLARYGIDLADPSSFGRVNTYGRESFFFAWYDGLMGFSGRDQVDYWMRNVNWSPALATRQGGGRTSVIGLVDFSVASGAGVDSRLISTGGYSETGTGHGAAVASLLVSPFDGRGLMGIAPRASIAAYNPYDSTLTAGWADVTSAVTSVVGAGASVVNMSLGVPGYTLHPDWANVYSDAGVQATAGRTIYVHAAGNDGLAQAQNIDWSSASQPHLLVVGSVGPTGVISPFSNTPGLACLTTGGACEDRNRLMNRFIVAPGEWILVSDGNGGVTRQSGTSLAAPLVTGAIALLQDRWGWLRQHPGATVDLILNTARDLGAPGVDPVYGHGMLDIAAAQAPINLGDVFTYEARGSGARSEALLLHRQRRAPTARIWGASGAGLTVFERLGDTYRDFVAPLDASLTGTTERVLGSSEAFRSYVHGALNAWSPTGDRRLVDNAQVANPFGWNLKMSASPLALQEQVRDGGMPYRTEFALTSPEDLTVRFGNGEGARALNGQAGTWDGAFAQATGGGNPLLGLASGGAFARVESPQYGGLRFNLGVTERRFDAVEIDPLSREERPLYQGLGTYRAMATNASVSRAFGDRAEVTAGYTYLEERNGLLGVQSLDPTDFTGRSRTDAVTVGLNYALNDRLNFTGSATYGRTRGSDGVQGLGVTDAGVQSTAFEAALDFNGVFGKTDRARLALVQPMHIETGALDVSGFEVVDRTTGDIGQVVRRTSISGRERVMALEAFYARPIMGDRAEIAAFLRAETGEGSAVGGVGAGVGDVVGLRFNLGF
ncbi:S8 family serine peptidase [bacterium]|nr:S8 family serine peptidase [bacterium]